MLVKKGRKNANRGLGFFLAFPFFASLAMAFVFGVIRQFSSGQAEVCAETAAAVFGLLVYFWFMRQVYRWCCQENREQTAQRRE